MVRTRGSGTRSVKAVAGSLTASPSLTKKKARKNTLSQPSLIGNSITTSKVVVIPDLEAPGVPSTPPASTALLAFVPGSSKRGRASPSDDVSDHDRDTAITHSYSSESPDVLAPKKKSKGWFQVSSSRKSPRSKGPNPSDSMPKASSLVGSTPRSKFRSKVKKIPPPCSSSESDHSSDFVPSDEDPLEEDPSLDENVSSEAESDPSEDPPVSPKGKKSVKILEIRTTVFGVIKNIEDRGWFGSLSGLDGFDPRVVQEFYANLNDDLFDSKSFMFGQVYVRGHWYLFSAAEISKVLNFPPSVDNFAVEFNKDTVLSELVGQNMVWEPHSVLKVTDLTHYYAVLHKFATNNWIPTTHTSTITFDTTFFLYKVGTGLQVDLATLIFDQITALGKAKKKGQYLSLRLEYEILTPPTAGADYKLKKEPSSVKATKGIALKAGDDDSVTTELAGVKATLESVQTEVFSLKSGLSTMMSHFAAGPSK
ncbi:uncharacterized protein LOC133786199 [Humulus lupulus]|uniref:uncharacterized protein LOC133786199 n=1 Tax=Humulus lupulus TaxID=3486 RepID=UPI002B405F7D|nr:uncharacterized protein LOC133786199 [Humulus lupulus]